MLASTSKEAFSDLLFKDGKPILEIRIEYPVAQGQITERFERTFDLYYERGARSLNLSARTGIYQEAVSQFIISKRQGLPFNMYSVIHDTQTTFVSEKYLSLCTRKQIYKGGSHGQVEMRGDVWSLDHARRLTLQEAADHKNPKAAAVSAVKSAIVQDKSGRFYPHALQTAEKAFDPRNFYITEEGLFVFYPLYTLAPYYAGIQVFKTDIPIK